MATLESEALDEVLMENWLSVGRISRPNTPGSSSAGILWDTTSCYCLT